MKCGECKKTDGLVYTSYPPKIRCRLTGNFHFMNDECDAVDAIIKHGHWIRSSDGAWAECSKCHASIDISMGSDLYDADGNEVEHDWCPHCGAKMDGMEDDIAVAYYSDNKPVLIDADKCPVCGGVRVNENDELLDICRQEWNYCPICGRFIGDEVKNDK